jgi:hypothetical protein
MKTLILGGASYPRSVLRSHLGLGRYLLRYFKHGVFVDSPLIQIVKKSQADFKLRNFVETGTFEGDTSVAMTFLFDWVYTCDVRGWPRALDFYCSSNLRMKP